MVGAIRCLAFTSILTSLLGCGLSKNAEPGGENGPEAIVPPCGHLPSHYRVTPAAACETTPFVCDTDKGAFVDACGCGCTWPGDGSPAYQVPNLPPNPERGSGEPSECGGGAAGPFARFESGTRRIVIGADAVYVFVPLKPTSWAMDAGADDTVWRVDKKTKGLTVVLDPSRVIADLPPDNVIANTKDCRTPLMVGAYNYSCTRPTLDDNHTTFHRTPITGGPSGALFAVPETAYFEFGFIVVGSDFYSITNDGALWHASALPGAAAPTILEQRGKWDDDDYWGLLAADRDAVYWQAGVDVDGYTSDDRTLTLFRKCRPSP